MAEISDEKNSLNKKIATILEMIEALGGDYIPEEVESSADKLDILKIAVENLSRKMSLKRESDQQELQKQQEMLSAVIENLPVAVFVKDVENDFRVTLWNKYSEELFQISKDTIIGKSAHDLWPKEQADFYLSCDNEAARGGKIIDIPEELSSSPSGDLTFHTKKVPLFLSDSKRCNHLLCISENITEKKKLEAELLRKQLSQETLLNLTKASIYMISRDGICTFANQQCGNLLGYDSAKELIGKNLHQLIHHTKEDGSLFPLNECGIYRVLEGRVSTHSDFDIFWHSNGIPIPVEWWSEPLIDGDVVTGAVVTFIDLTEKIKKQKEVDIARQEVDRIFDLSLDMLGVFDFQGYFRKINPAFTKILGYSFEEFTSRPFIDFVHPEDVPKTLNAVEHLAVKLSSSGFENRYRTKSGTYRILSWLGVSVNELGLIYCTARDVTDQRQKDLLIVQSSKLSALGEMAAGVAHEINNPLAIISGKTQQLLRAAKMSTFDPEWAKKQLTIIDETTKRAEKIVRGLRAFSREGGKDPFVTVKVASIVEDTLSLCTARIKNHNVELEVIDQSHGENLDCRPVQIGQILLNLLNNALDAVEALPKKWIQLQVSIEKDWVIIKVTDSGQGIPVEIQNKIMMPFFTTKPIGKGTGLGLSITNGIVTAHGGKFEIDASHTNTCFVVKLPKYQSKADRKDT